MIEPHRQGVVVHVKAHAGARRNRLFRRDDGALHVEVTQAPERGKANAAIVELLADRLGLKRSQVALLSGETAAQKRFLLVGLSLEEAAARIDAACNS